DRSIAGFEALARWDHPKLGRMSPSEFISIAEEIGLIVDLGMFVMDQTARQLSVWQRAMRSREPIFASVNVSSRQLLRHDLIHDIRTVLSRSSVARGSLKLELTESLVMENPEHAAQMLTRIKELGAWPDGRAGLDMVERSYQHHPIRLDSNLKQLDQNIGRINPSLRGPTMLYRSRVGTFVIAVASVIVPGALVFGQEQTQTFTAHPSTQEPSRLVTLETLKKWEGELSNWGRW